MVRDLAARKSGAAFCVVSGDDDRVVPVTHAHTHMHTYTNAHTHIHTHTYTHTFTLSPSLSHTHTYTHKYTHTHTHTPLASCLIRTTALYRSVGWEE